MGDLLKRMWRLGGFATLTETVPHHGRPPLQLLNLGEGSQVREFEPQSPYLQFESDDACPTIASAAFIRTTAKTKRGITSLTRRTSCLWLFGRVCSRPPAPHPAVRVVSAPAFETATLAENTSQSQAVQL